jgi:hypothetical protein
VENTENKKKQNAGTNEVSCFSEKIWSMFAKEKQEECVDPEIAVPACADALCKLCAGCQMAPLEFYGLLEDMRTFFDQILKDLKNPKE